MQAWRQLLLLLLLLLLLRLARAFPSGAWRVSARFARSRRANSADLDDSESEIEIGDSGVVIRTAHNVGACELGCGHVLHVHGMVRALKSARPECPKCRAPLDEADADADADAQTEAGTGAKVGTEDASERNPRIDSVVEMRRAIPERLLVSEQPPDLNSEVSSFVQLQSHRQGAAIRRTLWRTPAIMDDDDDLQPGPPNSPARAQAASQPDPRPDPPPAHFERVVILTRAGPGGTSTSTSTQTLCPVRPIDARAAQAEAQAQAQAQANANANAKRDSRPRFFPRFTIAADSGGAGAGAGAAGARRAEPKDAVIDVEVPVRLLFSHVRARKAPAPRTLMVQLDVPEAAFAKTRAFLANARGDEGAIYRGPHLVVDETRIASDGSTQTRTQLFAIVQFPHGDPAAANNTLVYSRAKDWALAEFAAIQPDVEYRVLLSPRGFIRALALAPDGDAMVANLRLRECLREHIVARCRARMEAKMRRLVVEEADADADADVRAGADAGANADARAEGDEDVDQNVDQAAMFALAIAQTLAPNADT